MARTIAKDYDEKRLAILKRAAKFFATHGFDNASMSSLAEECGISKALIYHYYRSKDSLLFDIIDSHLTGLIAVIDAVPHADDPEVRLRSLARALLEAYKDADSEHQLQLHSMARLSVTDQKSLASKQRKIVAPFASAIADIVPDQKENAGKMLKPLTMSLMGMLNWFFLWYKPGAGLRRADYAELACDLLIGGLEKIEHAHPSNGVKIQRHRL